MKYTKKSPHGYSSSQNKTHALTMKWLPLRLSLYLPGADSKSQVLSDHTSKDKKCSTRGFFWGGVGLCTWVCEFFFYKVWVWKGKILWGRGKGKQPPESLAIARCIAMHSCRKLLPGTDNPSRHRNLAIIHLPSPSIAKLPGAQWLKAFYESL